MLYQVAAANEKRVRNDSAAICDANG